MPKSILNPITGKFDFVLSESELNALYLKLDQTTPQAVDNGAPILNKGLRIKAGEKIYFDA